MLKIIVRERLVYASIRIIFMWLGHILRIANWTMYIFLSPGAFERDAICVRENGYSLESMWNVPLVGSFELDHKHESRSTSLVIFIV